MTIVGSGVAAILSAVLALAFRWPPPNHNPALVHFYPEYLDANRNISSFPSQATAVYSAVASGVTSTWRTPGVFLWMAVIFLVALPRMFVGGHYPSDVIIGVACGLASYAFLRSGESIFQMRGQAALQKSSTRLFATLFVFIAILELSTGFHNLSWVQRAITLYTSSNSLRIGGDSFFGQFFRGDIDEVRIYNRARSEAEIQRDMSTPVASSFGGARSENTGVCPGPGGLVAAYTFDEGFGQNAADTSGCANNGKVYRATWSEGKFGHALTFDGAESWVTIKDAPSLRLTGGMTLEAWVRPTSAASRWRDVIYKEVDLYFLAASSDPKTPAAGGTFHDAMRIVHAPSPLTLNQWSHLAATYDGSMLRLFVNGAEVSSRAERTLLLSSSREYFLK